MKKNFFLILISITVFTGSCTNNKSKQALTKKEQTFYLEKGKTIAQQSFMTLSHALKKSMSEKGIEGAVTYCNTNAFPLVDSLSDLYNATIRRTSLKVRNPLDKPNKNETEVLNFFDNELKAGKKISPKVTILENGKVAFYAPIMIKSPLCLTCHGKLGETLSVENYQTIQKLYPDDKATDYSINDLRGMWSIVFDKE
ncbi:MAG: DUF3365 domain-containing protein [Chlorobi bacterium]|nr:DUF3365 domain-containing protein [Chlorobiota bacterium]